MSATTGIGNASVIHQVIIRPPTANTFEAACPTWKGSTKYKIKATTKPASKEISLRFCFETTAKGVVYYFKIQRSLLNHADVKLNHSYKHKKQRVIFDLLLWPTAHKSITPDIKSVRQQRIRSCIIYSNPWRSLYVFLRVFKAIVSQEDRLAR